MNLSKFYDIALHWVELYAPSIIIAIVVFFTGQWMIRVIKKWLYRAMERKEISSSLRPFLQSLVITLLQILLLLIVLQLLSVRLTIFTAIVTSLGVAAGLALSGTLQNFTGGVLILLLKPFKVGDNIIAQGHDGIVESIEIFYTIITTADNRSVIIPNSKLSNEVIVNISRQGSRRLDIELKFSYAYDIEKIKKLLLDSITSFPNKTTNSKIVVGVSTLDPDGFKMTVQVWIDALKYYDLKFVLQQKLINDLQAAGIKLPGMP
ncbi:mechanosensitive ion channel family protein [Chryseosolibacter indicus]|uniref:Mechanosensitive ion channel n=1 Tax=Chryseosolibacter indicus TaxID=2782351 RepID=A0ABS5VJY0_9BACT|nr:mechanosensitive ion channel domain-containing protein [Chryseosolibacter indicus]MBT1701691.1 mechanosensitive ion channel [Chryseosolibacter indicus]